MYLNQTNATSMIISELKDSKSSLIGPLFLLFLLETRKSPKVHQTRLRQTPLVKLMKKRMISSGTWMISQVGKVLKW